ncbi:MAG: hypothetical protein ACLPTF_15955 [Steroidobacteraceae bacterium]
MPEHETQALIDFFGPEGGAIVAAALFVVVVVLLAVAADEVPGFVPAVDETVPAGGVEVPALAVPTGAAILEVPALAVPTGAAIVEVPTLAMPTGAATLGSGALAGPVTGSATRLLATVPFTAPTAPAAPVCSESAELPCVELHPLTAKPKRSAAVSSRWLRAMPAFVTRCKMLPTAVELNNGHHP